MLRYLRAAFWAAPEIRSLGRVPWNALGVVGFAILGFGHAGFWLLGLAGEMTYLYALTMNDRFRRLVDAEEKTIVETSAEAQRQALVSKLAPPARAELAKIEVKCEEILRLYAEVQPEEFVVVGCNREALQKLSWLYLKLLLARQNLQSLDPESTERELRAKIEKIERDLASVSLTPSLRKSKEATRNILLQRLLALDRREQTLEEIASDLLRIEAQIDLAVDHAGMRGKPETISSNIDLVSQLLDDTVYGDSGASIAALEQTYSGGSI